MRLVLFGSLPTFPLCSTIVHFPLNSKIIFPINGFTIVEQRILKLFFIELIVTFIL
ncbi:unnamed protein product [Choristocarpus tenellus]